MKSINSDIVKKLYRPPKDSHKGQNGKLTIIGGSSLFHGASLWALKIASRIVDMVFYSTVKENEELTRKLKTGLYDFICAPRNEIENYIDESDAVLIGPGMMRSNQKNAKRKTQNAKTQLKTKNIARDEREEDTREITRHLLAKFPQKKWIIDAGALQMMEADWLNKLSQVIITPHRKEFVRLFKFKITVQNLKFYKELTSKKAKKYGCVIVLKGKEDIICSSNQCLVNKTGNEGMTKGGTGDVLAGLIAALACKNDLFLAAAAGAHINGLAGDRLYKKQGPYFNATDLCDEIPIVYHNLAKRG